MRPHILEIEGFGPFSDLQRIDFDAAGEDGIFLIAGPTGAGKTTLLDALCFALYNTVPGARGAARELRSALAPPHTPTRVRLEFSVRGRRFRVERSPQYARPRKRGTGTTVQAHRVALSERVDGEWNGIGRTAQEVQSFLQDLLGLTGEQFTKLILLPQGEFAAFLHADPGEREGILTRLFATEHFAEVEKALAARATEARRHTQTAEERRRFQMERASRTSWEELPLPRAGAAELTDLLAHLGTAAVVAREACEVRAHSAALAQELADRTSEDAAALRQRAEDRTALRELEDARREWEAGENARRETAQQLRRARAAAPLLRLRDEARSAGRLAETAGAQRERARRRLADALPEDRSPESVTAEALTRARSALTEAHTRMERTAALSAAAARAEAAAEQAQAEHAAAQTALRTAEEELAASRSALEDAESGIEATESAPERTETLRGQREALRAAAEAAAEKEVAQQEYATAAAEAEEAASALVHLRREIRLSLAGRLAQTLIDDEECPVCGSRAHPAPAQLPPRSPSAEQEEAAEAAERGARERLAAARTRFEAAETALAARQEKASALDPDALEREWAEVRAEMSRREELLEARRVLRTRVKECAARAEALRTAHTRTEAAHASARTAAAEARARADQASEAPEETPESLTDLGMEMPRTAEAAARLLRVLDDLEALHRAWTEAEESARTAERERSLRRRDLAEALGDSPFADEEDLAAAAALPLSRLEADVTQAQTNAARLQDRAASPQVRRALEDPLGDEELAARAAAAASTAQDWRERAEEARNLAAIAGSAAGQARASRREAEAARGDEEAQLREWLADIDLAELVQGTSRDAAQRMSLSSFALTAAFAEVAAQASERLLAMTAGRYRLEHALAQGPREKRAGLGLRVVDTFTDESRDPRTLSGGESFMAALALALGLADTVRASSAGAEMETLFLDEGFGTLDPDALADVLAVLDGLRSGGRTIGIISHVSELRQTLPTRLLVTPGPGGSVVTAR
ncbi:SMC family ATPase [Brevibacterium sp.]|uniref:AAA family ATPase n=1 Tax=Brevibacterium sp. TaxID=1701 RepID=UPI0025BA0A23|nr:SMC family ATPase [Brevibacterium sp.]